MGWLRWVLAFHPPLNAAWSSNVDTEALFATASLIQAAKGGIVSGHQTCHVVNGRTKLQGGDFTRHGKFREKKVPAFRPALGSDRAVKGLRAQTTITSSLELKRIGERNHPWLRYARRGGTSIALDGDGNQLVVGEYISNIDLPTPSIAFAESPFVADPQVNR